MGPMSSTRKASSRPTAAISNTEDSNCHQYGTTYRRRRVSCRIWGSRCAAESRPALLILLQSACRQVFSRLVVGRQSPVLQYVEAHRRLISLTTDDRRPTTATSDYPDAPPSPGIPPCAGVCRHLPQSSPSDAGRRCSRRRWSGSSCLRGCSAAAGRPAARKFAG